MYIKFKTLTKVLLFLISILYYGIQGTAYSSEWSENSEKLKLTYTNLSPQRDESVRLLSTYEDHKFALKHAFQTAHKRILITNYGKLYPNAYKDLIDLMYPARLRGVKIYYRYNFNQRTQSSYPAIPDKIRAFFNEWDINVAQFTSHAKIIAVDHHTLIVGSFNWLSTSRDEVNPNHKFEAIAICTGEIAQKNIEEFYKTDIGRKINSILNSSKKTT